MSEITAILTRTNPLGTTLLLIGDDLLSDGELVTSAEVGKDVFEKLLTFAENNQEVRVVISYADDSHLKLYDYANTVVEDEDGYKGVILEKTGICLYNGTEPTIGDDIAPFVNAGGGGGSDLPEVDSDDNGKVLTVVSGEWDKATPAGGMNVLKLEVQDWGNEYVLCKAYPESGTFDNNNFDTYDAIDLYPNDSTIGNFEFRRFIFQGVESNGSAVFANIIQNNGIIPNAISDATSMVVLESTFTWNSSEWYWSCAHSPSN